MHLLPMDNNRNLSLTVPHKPILLNTPAATKHTAPNTPIPPIANAAHANMVSESNGMTGFTAMP